MRNRKPVLLVDDDQVDAMMVRRAFKDAGVTNRLIHIDSGEAALEFLQDEQAEKPNIILLNMNMPRMNGVEFLKKIKRDSELRKMPVIILTISTSRRHRVESFDLGAVGYIVKPVDYEQFVEAIAIIDRYWTLSELPD